MKNTEEIFNSETRKKKLQYVKSHQTCVVSDDSYIHVDLGSCASVILCGIDGNGMVWLGANHMFKSRDDEGDVSIQHIASLYNDIQSRGVDRIRCLGLFGGAYREKSAAQKIARTNITSIMETLSLFNLDIEIFQTGFSQGITVLTSGAAESIILKHRNFQSGATEFYQFPVKQFFGKKKDAPSPHMKSFASLAADVI